MAIITKGSNLEKGSEVEFTLNIADLLAHASVSGDAYFSDQSRWDKVLVNYGSEGHQKEILIFKNVDNGNTDVANFGVFSNARDLFEVQSIIIMDKQGGYLCIKRSDLVAADFDVDFSVAALRVANFNNEVGMVTASSHLNNGSAMSRLAFFSWIYVDDIGGADKTNQIFYSQSFTSSNVINLFTNQSGILVLAIGDFDIVTTPMIYNQWVLVGFSYIGHGWGGSSAHLILNDRSVPMPSAVPSELRNSLGRPPVSYFSNGDSHAAGHGGFGLNGKVSTTGVFINNPEIDANDLKSIYNAGHSQDPYSIVGTNPRHLYLFDDNQGDTSTTITDKRIGVDLTVSQAISYSDYDGE